MKIFLAWTSLGTLVTLGSEAILYFSGGWNRRLTIWNFHIHHSVLGLLLIFVGFILAVIQESRSKKKTDFRFALVYIGLGIIIAHTITDGKLVFIEGLNFQF